ncbi:MAG: terminase TerL endonuclease subunit [Solirubrobacteraceae bacterium]
MSYREQAPPPTLAPWVQCTWRRVGDGGDGEPVWVGVDVGGERSASAVVWVNADLHVGCAIYHGDAGVLECVEQVRDLAGRYSVREVIYDPWRFGQAAQGLARERITVLEFPQTDVRMVPASVRLHAAIVERRLTLPDDPELAQHAANTVARHSRRGWRIDKASPRDNMDAVVALAMALERAEQPPAAPTRLVGWM